MHLSHNHSCYLDTTAMRLHTVVTLDCGVTSNLNLPSSSAQKYYKVASAVPWLRLLYYQLQLAPQICSSDTYGLIATPFGTLRFSVGLLFVCSGAHSPANDSILHDASITDSPKVSSMLCTLFCSDRFNSILPLIFLPSDPDFKTFSMPSAAWTSQSISPT